VGSGTGQWAFDLCAELPHAKVVGLDLVVGKPGPPANYRFVQANVLQGLPFRADSFDFVHQRFLTAGLPLKSWSGVVQDLVRVTRPGGWVELVEAAPWIEPAGPATARLSELAWRLGMAHGLDTTGIVFRSLDERLRRAGMSDVEKQQVDLPIGEWGGRIGSFMASDFRAVFTRLSDVFQARFDISAIECHALVRTMQLEWEQNHSGLNMIFAFGRKPERSQS
jgi:SAM-dependent methyltransferase